MSLVDDTSAPAAPAAEFFRAEITPENLFRALGRLRKEAFDEIERLLHFLDECDGDDDLEPYLGSGQDGGDDREAEPESDEPSLGTLDGMMNQQHAAKVVATAYSAFIDAELDNSNDEPSLGTGNTHHNQTRWTEGNRDEREGDGCADDCEGDELQHGGDEHDGKEPEEQEPSLGSPDGAINQTLWGHSALAVYEFADAEQGVGPSPEKVEASRQRRNHRRSNVGRVVASSVVDTIDLAERLYAGPRRRIDGLTSTQANVLRRCGLSGAVTIGRMKE